tara:strand:- start:433 stop:960 length:528 start_codon:yes stop_codon:yes gene_type:complete
MTGSFQLHKYFINCIDFCKKLNKSIQLKDLIVRLHARRFWDEGLFFKNEFPKIEIDEGYKSIYELIANSRLVVHSYIATGYLETLSANFPTIVFSNLKDFMLTQETQDDLKILYDVKIFHPNYESAAKFINENYQNIDDWWKNGNTQKAIRFFCNKYAKKNNSKIEELTKVFNND